jgi:hypothetical protein
MDHLSKTFEWKVVSRVKYGEKSKSEVKTPKKYIFKGSKVLFKKIIWNVLHVVKTHP